tara:strand:- start:21334 stop:22575 length:1242 start_codon:yes stop_codon:yes gene_type:complete
MKIFSLRILSLTSILIYLGSSSLYSQESFNDFLLTAFEDINLQQFDAQMNFLKKSNYSIPIIDRLEIRGGNNEFTKEDQQYAFRIRPSNPWKIRRNNALFNATKKELSIHKKLQFAENLQERYEIALDYLLEKELAEIREERFNIIKQRAQILGSNQQSNLFDPKDFVEAKLDQIESLNSIEEANSSKLYLEQQIALILQTTSFNWDNEGLISVLQIQDHSTSIAQNVLPSTELELIAQQVEVAKHEVRVEKADFNIGFFQTEYFPFRDKNSDYGISVGLTIPLFKPNKNKIAERKLDEIELQNEYFTQQYTDSVNRILNFQYLQQMIAQHQMLEKQIDELDLDSAIDNINRIEDNNPLSLLDLKEGILKLEEVRLKSSKNILEQYLEFLKAFDALGSLPLINHLSSSLAPLK